MRSHIVIATILLLATSGQALADQENTPREKLRVDRCDEVDTGAALDKEARTNKAADHYDRGLVLYEEGNYAGAVDEFVSSYCTYPHPNSFYNIAQSYERMLDYERAVLYFERYLSEAGEKASNYQRAQLRAEVLRNLPARLRVATMPAGAKITLLNEAGIIARGTANESAPILVQQGRYTMRIEMPGFVPTEATLDTQIGQPYSYYYELEPEQTDFEVVATPSNSRIFIDDRLVGVGSFHERMPLGTYNVTVEAPGRRPTDTRVQLTANKPTNLQLELEKPPVSGRRELLVGSALALGGATGYSMQRLFGQDEGVSAIVSLAATGVGFGGAYYGIPESVSRGDAWFLIGSTGIGALEGFIVGSFFGCSDGGVDEECKRTRDGSALAGAVLALGSGTLLRDRLDMSTGDTAVLASGVFWGASSSLIFYSIFDAGEGLAEPMLFAGTNIGLVTAASVVANSEISLGRIAIIDLAGIGGLIGGVALATGVADGDENVAHLGLLGAVTGLVSGAFFTRNFDKKSSSSKKLQSSLSSVEDASGQRITTLGMQGRF